MAAAAVGILIYNKAWIRQANDTIQIFLNDPQAPQLEDKIQHAFIDLAAKGQWLAVEAFVESGVLDINVMPAGRWSALHHAAFAQDAEAIQMLTSHGAERTLKAIPEMAGADRDVPGEVTPLQVAQRMEAPPEIEAILK